jgi:hypothetical protein
MSDRYFVTIGSERKGPYTINQLRAMWNSGAITGDDLYCDEEGDTWLHLRVLSDQLEPSASAAQNASTSEWPYPSSGMGATTKKSPYAGPKPHRGTMVLALSIVGIFFFPAAIIALIIGNSDMREMELGKMDASGKGITDIGCFIAVISLILWGGGIGIIAYFIFS